jgi:hypothetical protein
MDRAVFERFCAFVSEFGDAFDGSRAHVLIGVERFGALQLELRELRDKASRALHMEFGRQKVLTMYHAQLLHECLCVAHACMNADANQRALMPDVFQHATRDACYVMQQVDLYLVHKRIDELEHGGPHKKH